VREEEVGQEGALGPTCYTMYSFCAENETIGRLFIYGPSYIL